MTLAPRRWAAEILHVWFRTLGPADWFGGSSHVDALLEQRFAREWHALRHRPAFEFLDTPDLARAAILLFDQVPRNMFRDDPRAFASDGLASTLATEAISRSWHRGLASEKVQFLAMPLMHSEKLVDQELSVDIFARHVPGALFFARQHRKMIARFGRFPHRNAVLGRTSTPAEKRAIAAGFSW